MALPTLHYLSHFEPSGYGLSAISMVRALRNAGYPVRWSPLKRVGYDQVAVMSWPQALSEASGWLRDDESLADLPALAAVTAQVPLAGAAGYSIAHVVPEHLSGVFAMAAESAHFERIAYTTWESDALPAHWLRCFDSCHRSVVPSRFNQAVFARDLRRPVHVVPHVRRHRLNEFSVQELVELRVKLDIAADEFVFYSINQFLPRKNFSGLIEAFVRAFGRADKAVLVIKTGAQGWADGPYFEPVQVRQHLQQMLLRLGQTIKSELPKICVIDTPDVGGQHIDALHALGDCFVSLTHGEGWNFLQIGKYLERADAASRILDLKYHILLPSGEQVGGNVDTVQWQAVLKSCSAFEAYRKIHTGQVAPWSVAEFILLHEDFPRSVRFCSERLDRALHRISGSDHDHYANEGERLSGRLCSDLRYAGIGEILRSGLHEYLDGIQKRLIEINSAMLGEYCGWLPPEEAEPEQSQLQVAG